MTHPEGKCTSPKDRQRTSSSFGERVPLLGLNPIWYNVVVVRAERINIGAHLEDVQEGGGWRENIRLDVESLLIREHPPVTQDRMFWQGHQDPGLIHLLWSPPPPEAWIWWWPTVSEMVQQTLMLHSDLLAPFLLICVSRPPSTFANSFDVLLLLNPNTFTSSSEDCLHTAGATLLAHTNCSRYLGIYFHPGWPLPNSWQYESAASLPWV